MESKSYLITFGERINSIRKGKKMSQVEFYRLLYPEVENSDANIMSTMRKIEHGRTKYLNVDFLLRTCSKFGISADYLLGLTQDYANHENEFVCNYTGLEEIAVKQLHDWNVDKNNGADISKIEEAFWEEEEEDHIKMHKKQDGIAMLRIVNYLFKSGERKSKQRKSRREPYSNISILYSLYLMSMAKPFRVEAYTIIEDWVKLFFQHVPNQEMLRSLEYTSVDLNKPIVMVDNNKVHYLVNPKKYLEVLGREQLEQGVNWLIEQVKRDESGENE